jgi:hypothetical protein
VDLNNPHIIRRGKKVRCSFCNYPLTAGMIYYDVWDRETGKKLKCCELCKDKHVNTWWEKLSKGGCK